MSFVLYNSYRGENQVGDLIDVPNREGGYTNDIRYFADELRTIFRGMTSIDAYGGLRYISDSVLNKMFKKYEPLGKVAVVQRYVPMQNGTSRAGETPYAANLSSPKRLRENFMEEVFGFCVDGVSSHTIIQNINTPEKLWNDEPISEDIDEQDVDMLVNIVVELINSTSSRNPNGNIVIKIPNGDEDSKKSIDLMRKIFSVIPPAYRSRISFSANAEIDYETNKKVSNKIIGVDELTNIMVVTESSNIEKMSGFDKKVIHSKDRIKKSPEVEWLYKWIRMSSEERNKLCKDFGIGENCEDIKDAYLSVLKVLALKENMNSLNAEEQKKLTSMLSLHDEDARNYRTTLLSLSKLKKDKERANQSIERYADLESYRKRALQLYEQGDYKALSRMDLNRLGWSLEFNLRDLMTLNEELSEIKGKVSIFHMKERKQQIEEKEKAIADKKASIEKVLKLSYASAITESETKAKNCVKRILILEDELKALKDKLNLDVINLYELLKSRPELLELVKGLKGIDFNSVINGIEKEDAVTIDDGKSR